MAGFRTFSALRISLHIATAQGKVKVKFDPIKNRERKRGFSFKAKHGKFKA
jgi:hypothetical protein